ncbi:MAG: UvrD-helicase domain-containing protein, partial [Bacteroidota bacterium]
MPIKIISAGAGSGKTYRLTQEMVQLLKQGVRASGIIATTFTTKAAAELQERVRVKLLEEGLVEEANALTNALIGTVHGLGVKLLKRFAFIAGVSPEVDIIADEDQQILFNQSLATVLRVERIQEMEHYSNRLGLSKKNYYDWRKAVKELTDAARSNDFSTAVLEESKQKSIASFRKFLDPPSTQTASSYYELLTELLEQTIDALKQNEDHTKKTQGAIATLNGFKNQLALQGDLNWHQWVKMTKLGVGAKSKTDIEALVTFAQSHEAHPDFHQDIEHYLGLIFDIAIEAIREYEAYKKRRGLIDYIDMETQVKRLLDHPQVQEILREELDLLMVDEFQDTNPIQLEIFLKLSNIAQHSVWVGDPKQSIYGFRGAEPRLMQEIIRQNGGIDPADIQVYSWRSREEIVYLTNALFVKAFDQLPVEQVALKVKRTRLDNPEDAHFKAEPLEMKDAL